MRRLFQSYWGLVPVLCLSGILMTLDRYGHMRMGMMRYLVFKNRQLESGLLHPDLQLLYTLIGLLIFCFSVYLLIRPHAAEKADGSGMPLALFLASGFWVVWALVPAARKLLIFDFGYLGAMGLTVILLGALVIQVCCRRMAKSTSQ